MSEDLSSDYRRTRENLGTLVRGLPQHQLDTPVPACPGWTVHDVISHLAGIAADAVAGRLGGVPTDEHTAGQVAERAGRPTAVVLREWERSATQLEVMLTRTPIAPVVFDVVVHEQDIRGALDMPGNRDDPVVDDAINAVLARFASRVQSAGLPDVMVVDGEGHLLGGRVEAPVRLTIPRYELFRAGFGRRSASQIEPRFYGGKGSAYLPLLTIFEPARQPILE